MRSGLTFVTFLIIIALSMCTVAPAGLIQKASAATTPDAPTNLTISANATSIILHWNAPASDGGSPITGYKIDHFASASAPTRDANSSSFQWGPVLVGDTNSTSTTFVDKRVVPTCYESYRVSARNAQGIGLPSNAVGMHFVSMYGTISDATNSCGINAFDLAIDSSGNFALASNFNVLIFDKDGVFKKVVQPLSNGKGYFGRATGVAFDRSDNLYVADVNTAAVYKIDTNGNLVKTFGKRGAGDGQFGSPFEVVVDNASNVYATDGSPNAIGANSKNRVEEFDSNGNYLRTIGISDSGNKVTNPVGIAVDKSNNLYVTDNPTNNPGIVKFDSGGNFVSRVVTSNGRGQDNGSSLINPTKLAVDSAGNIYVLDSGYIKKYKPDGTFISTSPNRLHFGAIITTDNSDNLYSLKGTPSFGPVLGARMGSYEDTRIALVNPNESVVPEFALVVAVLASSLVAVVLIARFGLRTQTSLP